MSIDDRCTETSAPAERYVEHRHIALRWSAELVYSIFYRHSTPLECGIFHNVPFMHQTHIKINWFPVKTQYQTDENRPNYSKL